ncbi:PREDICTED: E3 ubiquitin-protein ligase Praja-2 [Tarenaya hassleriana]|uniref:E3 ubiquitin-protein ligase Praja-2 n=1 Tax=Tarenaya hassleriana TaxID=28532 RepID=UPI00053C9E1A|nr:PREDICTED: E3 ubiquitin-protein ligase Praja-2 [Tarenaya hassleriana]
MAETSCLQIHGPNDAVSHRHSHNRGGESLTQILESNPHWVHADDFDLYISDAVFAVDVLVSDSVVPASDGLDLLDRRSFVMDLFRERVEQSQVTPHDIDENEVAELSSESGFGVIEGNCDVGIGTLELLDEFGLESGGEFVVEDIGDSSDIDSVDLNPNDYDEHVDADFYIERRSFRLESRDVASAHNDIRVIESGSDDDEDGLEGERDIWGIELNAEDVYEDDDGDDGDDDDDASVTIPLCWDSLQLEDRGVTNEDFEWENVDGGLVDEREILSVLAEADYDDENSISISVSPIITLEDLASGEREEGLGNLGWEVLLNSRNLETNPDSESNRDMYLGVGGDLDDYIGYLDTTEYEMLFEQFSEAEISAVGQPPAAKAFVKNLPLVVLSKEDVGADHHALCAVCKDEMNVGSEAAQLPCSHRYHSECILPWLGIRNTCPVCRYELPTDDAEYERRRRRNRSQRAANGL